MNHSFSENTNVNEPYSLIKKNNFFNENNPFPQKGCNYEN